MDGLCYSILVLGQDPAILDSRTEKPDRSFYNLATNKLVLKRKWEPDRLLILSTYSISVQSLEQRTIEGSNHND
ncbi:hypothetical protein Avbf_02794 [Armadillidium vulgare]|nr:hypothetical protein Avbf_02794 [Armadillidium vulgare]